MDRRNLAPGASPFKFNNPDAAARRQSLVEASKSRSRALTDLMNQRAQPLRRKKG